MSDQKKSNGEDTYDMLHRNFSLFGDEPFSEPEESDVKNSGEIYFSAGSTPQRTEQYDFDRYLSSPRGNQPSSGTSGIPSGRSAPIGRVPTGKKNSGRTAAPSKKRTSSKGGSVSPAGNKSKKKNSSVGFLLAALVVVFVLVASIMIRIPIMGCVSDILAIDRDTTEFRVILEQDTKTKDVIKILGNKNLIYSTGFCKLMSGFLGYESEDVFPAGTYYLSPSMGIEGMLRTMRSTGSNEATVKVTLPEGFTVDQIIAKLAQNGVASENALYSALNDDSFYEDYKFLAGITNKEERYRVLEGYLYPDTYEFYIDENPISVFRRFLDNFNNKWEADFAAQYNVSGYSIDEILTVASILEKEAKDAEQMPLIASILYNRLASSSFPWINCDSTGKYIEAQEERLTQEGTYVWYYSLYNTYQKTGLPVGPICNPGSDAISAALSPDATDYYYFLHDADGKIYTARTEAEHIANQQYMNTNVG